MTLTIEVRSKPGKVNELYQTLQALLPTMRREKGCLNCRVSQAMEDCEVCVLSGYRDAQARFEGYLRTVSGSALLGAINMLGQSTRIQMGRKARWDGVEMLQRIRREA